MDGDEKVAAHGQERSFLQSALGAGKVDWTHYVPKVADLFGK